MWPFSEWIYLGYQEISYVDSSDKNTKEVYIIHFYGKGKDLEKRKVDWQADGFYAKSQIEKHGYYQKMIVPWLNGGAITKCIGNPSNQLESFVRKKFGYKYDHTKNLWVEILEGSLEE